MGNYHGTASRYETILRGIQDSFDGRVLFSEGCHLFRGRVEGLGLPGDRIAEAVIVAEHSDVVILCVGLDETLEGEQGDASNTDASGDKITLALPEPQRLLVKKVLEVGKPTVVVVVSGSSLNIESDKENALLQVFYPGSTGGKAVAEVLFGETSPSGKLPVTFYKDVHKLPDFTDYSMRYRTYRNERTEDDNVLFPFGYGLSYGDIRVTGASAVCENGVVKATASLKNFGRATKDVLQVYFKSESADAVRNHSLCAFKKVSLGEGETAEVELSIPEADISVVNEFGTRYLDRNAKTTLYFGTSQPDAQSEALTGKKCVAVDLKL